MRCAGASVGITHAAWASSLVAYGPSREAGLTDQERVPFKCSRQSALSPLPLSSMGINIHDPLVQIKGTCPLVLFHSSVLYSPFQLQNPSVALSPYAPPRSASGTVGLAPGLMTVVLFSPCYGTFRLFSLPVPRFTSFFQSIRADCRRVHARRPSRGPL